MERLAAAPPEDVSGVAVTSVTDYSRGAADRPRYLAATQLVLLELGDLGRLLVRPSGTEPKLKIYGDLRGDAAGIDDLGALESSLLEQADDLAHAMVDYLGLA